MRDEIMRAEIYGKAVETKKRNAEASEEENSTLESMTRHYVM